MFVGIFGNVNDVSVYIALPKDSNGDLTDGSKASYEMKFTKDQSSKSAKLAKEAYKSGRTIRELATEKKLMTPAQLRRALDLTHMTKPGR